MAKPTKEQLVWRDLELGVLIHYCMEIYRPELKGDWYKTKRVRTEIAPETLDPKKLDPAQWVRSAEAVGAKYAVLVANHCTGFSLWNTAVNDFSIAHTKWRGGYLPGIRRRLPEGRDPSGILLFHGLQRVLRDQRQSEMGLQIRRVSGVREERRSAGDGALDGIRGALRDLV